MALAGAGQAPQDGVGSGSLQLLEVSVGDVPDPCRNFCGATDVAFAQNGHVLVSDGYRNARVIEYDAGGSKVREWGKRGPARGNSRWSMLSL